MIAGALIFAVIGSIAALVGCLAGAALVQIVADQHLTATGKVALLVVIACVVGAVWVTRIGGPG